MPGQSVEGVVWARPEAGDALGRRPGSARSVLLAVVGCVSVAVGVALGTNVMGQPAAPTPAVPGSGAATAPDAEYLAWATQPTCSALPVTIPADRVPPEGIQEVTVVALYRVDPSGQTTIITPRAHVLKAAPDPDGAARLTVLVRMGPPGDDQQVADVLGANAAGALSATVLYGVDPYVVLDECEGKI
jgi:hypothetical protein